MTPRAAIQKGKDLENFIADLFARSGLDRRAVRQLGSGNGKRKGDVDNDLGWCIESKNTASFRWKEAALQVQRQAMNYQKECVVWHPPGTPLDKSVAIININDFIELLQRFKDPVIKEPDRAMKWKLQRFIQSAKEVLKELNQNEV